MNILIIDDHPLFREGLKFLLRSLDSELTIDEAGDCQQAIGFAGKRGYDLLLLDLNMPGLSGLDALDTLHQAFPLVALVVISGDHTPQMVRDAIDRGAMGFIPKSSTPDQLVHALRQVLDNRVYLPGDVLAKAGPEAAGDLPALTPRQLDVLRRVIQGKPNKAVANELGVSTETVKSHLAAVMRALNARNRTELVYIAAKRSLRLE